MNRGWIFAIFGIFMCCISIGSSKRITTPAPQITTYLQQKHAAEPFSEVVLSCDEENHANESLISWKYKNVKIFEDFKLLNSSLNSTYSVDENNSLRIANFSFNLAGGYVCTIPNLHKEITHVVGLADQKPEIIVTESGKNVEVELPCHPAMINSTQIIARTEYEWVTENDVPVFANRHVLPFINFNRFENDYEVNYAILTIHRISAGNHKLTCRLLRLNTNYTYHIQVNKPEIKYKEINKTIKFNAEGETVILPCLEDNDNSTTNSNYTWISRKNKQIVQVISLNERILLQNNTAGFRVAENRSLIIPNFKPSYLTHYECRLSNGQIFRHLIDASSNQNTSSEIITTDKPIIVWKRSFRVHYASEQVAIYCPHKEGNTSFEWIFKNELGEESLLSVERENFAHPFNEYYEIFDNDGTLIIEVMERNLYGVYTCRLSTGEQSIYNITQYERVWRNETILVNDGATATLPCPITESRDQDFGITVWHFSLPKANYFADFRMMEGKLYPASPNSPTTILDNAKLAENKQSLIVSNISSIYEGDYICSVFPSNTTYKYTIEVAKNA